MSSSTVLVVCVACVLITHSAIINQIMCGVHKYTFVNQIIIIPLHVITSTFSSS